MRAFFFCMAWTAIQSPLSKLKRRLDSLEATQWTPRDTSRDSRGERTPLLLLEARSDPPCETGMRYASVLSSNETDVSGTFGVASRVAVTFHTSRRNMGLLLRRCSGQGPHLAKKLETRGLSRVAAGFSIYDGDFRLPLVSALGSPIFHSSGEGKLGVALESLQGQRDLI